MIWVCEKHGNDCKITHEYPQCPICRQLDDIPDCSACDEMDVYEDQIQIIEQLNESLKEQTKIADLRIKELESKVERLQKKIIKTTCKPPEPPGR